MGFQDEDRDVEVRLNRTNGPMCLLALPKTRFPRADNRVCSVGDLQLGEDVGDVVAPRLRAQVELLGDGGVRVPLGDDVEDLELPVGERREGLW